MTASEKVSDIVFRGCFLLLWLQPIARPRLAVNLLLSGCLVFLLLNRFAALPEALSEAGQDAEGGAPPMALSRSTRVLRCSRESAFTASSICDSCSENPRSIKRRPLAVSSTMRIRRSVE